MNVSPSLEASTDRRPFASGELDSSVVLRESNRIWFGFPWQKGGGIGCFLFAFVLVGVGIFLEGEGLIANLRNVEVCIGGTAALAVALAFALVGVKLRRSTDRVGVLDLEKGCFAAVDQKSGKAGSAFPCADLYMHMVEAVPADGDAGMHGKITIVGPAGGERWLICPAG